MTTEAKSLTELMAESWSATSFDDIPPEVVDIVKDHILDTLAVALACANTEEAQRTTSAMTALAAQTNEGSRLWGSHHKLPPAQAALVNGTVTHARDYDDGGGPGHGGSTVVPAVLAIAEQLGSTGRTVIESTVAGYDIGARVLKAVGGFPQHTSRGWHTSGTLGSFAAAAGAAKCLGLDADQFTHSLGIAGSFTGGVWAFIEDSAMSKRLHPGKAGETGVDAALLARAGFTGPRFIFEASWGGIYSTYNGGVSERDEALAGLGTQFLSSTTYIKPYACCRGSHSAIDALLGLMRSEGITAEDVEGIEIHAAETAVNMLSVAPIKTVFDAQFNLPYAAALALNGGTLTLAEFDPPRLDDAKIRSTYASISIVADPTREIEDGPLLEVTLRDGRHVVLTSGSPTNAKGSVMNPMTHAEVVAKAETLLEPLGSDVAAELARAVEGLNTAPDIGELLHALRPRLPQV